MRSSNFFPLLAFLTIASLFVSMLILPTGHTYTETCPTCQGNRTVTCESCNGSGKCSVCEGTGRIWYMPEPGNWCAFCQGTGICSTCEGLGWHECRKCEGKGFLAHWIYNLTGTTTILSFTSIILFIGIFILSVMASAIHLSFNEWIYGVNHMDFWFNPSFMTWLFAKHRKRWVKWQTILNVMISMEFGILLFGFISLRQITLETFLWGTLFSIAVVSSFSFFFYKSYISRLEHHL